MPASANPNSRSLLNIAVWGIALTLLMGLGWQTRSLWWPSSHAKEGATAKEPPSSPTPACDDRCVQLAKGTTDTLEVAPATVNSMHLTSAVVAPANHPDQLRLTGQLTLDPARLVHVHS